MKVTNIVNSEQKEQHKNNNQRHPYYRYNNRFVIVYWLYLNNW